MNRIFLGSLFSLAVTALRALNESRTRYAVVQPIFHDQLKYLREFSAALKCKHAEYPIDLVIYFSGSRDDTIPPLDTSVGTYEGYFKKPWLGSCFRSIVWKYANISQDVEYPKAPSDQFFAMLATTPPMWGYDAIYQMELDVLPLHEDWLGRIFPLLAAAGGGRAWVIGGTYDPGCMYLKRRRRDEVALGFDINGSRWKHINGNAVYTSRRDFIEWALPLERREDVPQGYDYFMYKYLLEDADPGNDDKYHASPMIMDCKPTEYHGSGDTKPTEYLRTHFPDAVLVHSRFLTNKKSTHLTVRDMSGTKTMVVNKHIYRTPP